MNLAPAFTGTGCLKTTGRDLLSFGCSEAAAGAMNPWNDSVDSISLRGSTVRAGSEARKAPGGFTPRTVNTDFRWKLGVLKAGEETPRGGKPPVWRNHKPAGSDANSMGEGSGQPQEGPPSQWKIPSTPKLQVPCLIQMLLLLMLSSEHPQSGRACIFPHHTAPFEFFHHPSRFVPCPLRPLAVPRLYVWSP